MWKQKDKKRNRKKVNRNHEWTNRQSELYPTLNIFMSFEDKMLINQRNLHKNNQTSILNSCR